MKDIIYKVSVMVTHTAAAGRSSALLGTAVWSQRERERGSSWGIIGYILRTGGVVVLRSVNTKTGFVNSDKK